MLLRYPSDFSCHFMCFGHVYECAYIFSQTEYGQEQKLNEKEMKLMCPCITWDNIVSLVVICCCPFCNARRVESMFQNQHHQQT